MAHRGRTNADDLLAAALAAGKTAREAATAAGVAERTVFRRLADDPFRRRVSEHRAAMLGTAAGRLADTMTSAADVLRGLLGDPDPDVRHRAAVKVIELGAKLAELTDIERRLSELEATANTPMGVSDGT